MESKLKIVVLILLGLIFIIVALVLNKNYKYNIYYDNYDNSEYLELDISSVQLRRYNEKLNNSTISYLVGNMGIIMDDEKKITNYGLIQYAMLVAERYDYRFEDNKKEIDGSTYVKVSYLQQVIKELFNVEIKLVNESVNIMDDYVEIDIKQSLLTDVFYLKLNKVLYNEKEDIYIVHVDFTDADDTTNVSIYNEDDLIKKNEMIIKYKKNKEGLNTILEYKEINI